VKGVKADIWYSTGDNYRYELSLNGSYDIHRPAEQYDIATQCADDFHSNHDGWEASWPRIFVLYESKSGAELARFEVERETVPAFFAYRETAPDAPAAPDDHEGGID